MASAMTQEVWYQRTEHLIYQDLDQLSRLEEDVSFVNDDDTHNKEHPFCEPCTLGKGHRFQLKR